MQKYKSFSCGALICENYFDCIEMRCMVFDDSLILATSVFGFHGIL